MQPHLVEEGFPSMRPNWDFEGVDSREHLRVFRQTLMARKPTNLSKVNLIRQEPNESPAAFLERLMKAFRQYMPMGPQADESRAAVLLALVNQAAPDISRKLQKIEGLGELSIQDLVRAAETVFNNRETPEEREERIRREEREYEERIRWEEREYRAEENWRNQKELVQILFAGTRKGPEAPRTKDTRSGGKEKPARPALKRDQCTYCKKQGHWKNECPKRDLKKKDCKKGRLFPGDPRLICRER